MNPEIINPLNKPTPVLSPAAKVGDFVYTAGQVGVDPETGKLAGPGIEEQTRQVMDNIKMLLEAAGSSMDKVFKCLVFIKYLWIFCSNSILKIFLHERERVLKIATCF